MRIAEAEQADALERLDFPSDRHPCLTTRTLDCVNLDDNDGDIVLPTALIRQGDAGGHQVIQGQACTHLCQLSLPLEVVVKTIRTQQEAIMGHAFDK